MSSPSRRVISHTVVADSHRDFRGTSLAVDLQDSKMDC